MSNFLFNWILFYFILVITGGFKKHLYLVLGRNLIFLSLSIVICLKEKNNVAFFNIFFIRNETYIPPKKCSELYNININFKILET